MRKKLDTRFPAARIKKIMQADEDVGKIAMAVPLLVSKALELFLQDLCDRTYEIKLQRGAKTLNSMHLKQCVQSCNVFDFLSDIVGKVPDLGGSEGAAAGEDRSATKRRKIADNEHNDGDEDLKRDKQLQPETPHVNASGRGRGRGRVRGRGCGRISRAEREANAAAASNYEKYELFPNNTDRPIPSNDSIQDTDSKDSQSVKVRNFDLNLDLDENGDTQAISTTPVTPVVPPPRPTVEMKTDEYPGWSLEDVEKMAIDPIHLANLNSRVDEDEEDYDEEG